MACNGGLVSLPKLTNRKITFMAKDKQHVSTEWLSDLGNDIAKGINWGLFTIKKPEGSDVIDLPATMLRSQAEAARFAATKPNWQERLDGLKQFTRDLQNLSRELMSDVYESWSRWAVMLVPAKDAVDLVGVQADVKAIFESISKQLKETSETDLAQYLKKISNDLLRVSAKAHPDYLIAAENGNGDIIRTSAPEAVRLGSQALLTALSRVPNNRVFDQIEHAKKANRRGRERKSIFTDAAAFGADLPDFYGSDDNVVMHAAAQILGYDQKGAIVDATKLITKCAMHFDAGLIQDAARIFAVLTGAKEVEHENRFGFHFGDEEMRKAVNARALALTGIAAAEIRRDMQDKRTKVDSRGNEVKKAADNITKDVDKALPPAPATTETTEAPSAS